MYYFKRITAFLIVGEIPIRVCMYKALCSAMSPCPPSFRCIQYLAINISFYIADSTPHTRPHFSLTRFASTLLPFNKRNDFTCACAVSWDFDRSADDWAKASSVEMDAEVQWRPSGTIRGTVRGPSPHLDSPPFLLPVNDRHHVVVRMKSSGPGNIFEWIKTLFIGYRLRSVSVTPKLQSSTETVFYSSSTI